MIIHPRTYGMWPHEYLGVRNPNLAFGLHTSDL